ncbi:MAG: ATP-binding cassette domain-containing protein [Ignisphaera sp.]
MNRIVDVKNLWLRYGDGNWVLKNISFSVDTEKTVLIIGRSGCGKTSFARALTGVAQSIFGAEVKGEIWLCGKRLEEMGLREIQSCVQMVNQDPYTHFLEPIPIDDLVSYAETVYGESALEHVYRVAQAVGVKDLLERPITSLSGGQLKRLSIAKALITNPSVLILDEPLMWLDDVDGTEVVLNTIRAARSAGKTVIVFEHRFKHLLGLADEIYIMRRDSLEKLGKELFRDLYADGSAQPTHSEYRYGGNGPAGRCDVVLELRDVWHRYDDSKWVLRGVSMEICRGDTIVVYGANGSGKSTLLRILAGVVKPVKGVVKRYADVVYVPQIPHLFITEDSIAEEINSICRHKKIGGNCIEYGTSIVKSFGYADLGATPLNLSWGQVTRLSTVLAYIASKNGVILLDEPFTGSTYFEAHQIIEALQKLESSAKIVTLSSKDYIPLIRGGKIYKIEDGVLKPFSYSENGMQHLVDLAKRIYGYE